MIIYNLYIFFIVIISISISYAIPKNIEELRNEYCKKRSNGDSLKYYECIKENSLLNKYTINIDLLSRIKDTIKNELIILERKKINSKLLSYRTDDKYIGIKGMEMYEKIKKTYININDDMILNEYDQILMEMIAEIKEMEIFKEIIKKDIPIISKNEFSNYNEKRIPSEKISLFKDYYYFADRLYSNCKDYPEFLKKIKNNTILCLSEKYAREGDRFNISNLDSDTLNEIIKKICLSNNNEKDVLINIREINILEKIWYELLMRCEFVDKNGFCDSIIGKNKSECINLITNNYFDELMKIFTLYFKNDLRNLNRLNIMRNCKKVILQKQHHY